MVVDCENKHGVYRKYRDIIRNVTVLDSDAEKEHQMIVKLKSSLIRKEHFIHKRGSLEDLFPAELHVLAINRRYFGGVEVTESDLAEYSRPGPIVERLKNVVWTHKEAQFDKISHAEELCELITASDQIPYDAKTITEKLLELAERQAKLQARPPSVYALDGLVKQIEFLTE